MKNIRNETFFMGSSQTGLGKGRISEHEEISVETCKIDMKEKKLFRNTT